MDYYYNPYDYLSFGGESVKVLIEGLYVFFICKTVLSFPCLSSFHVISLYVFYPQEFLSHYKGSWTLAMGKCLWFSVKIKVCQSSLASH